MRWRTSRAIGTPGCARCTCTTACMPTPIPGPTSARRSARRWPFRYRCCACGYRSMPATAWRRRRGKRGARPSPRRWRPANGWRWRSTATTRPRPSCCARCAPPARTGWRRCSRCATSPTASCGGRCWRCRGANCRRTRSGMRCSGSKIPAMPIPASTATSCACACCRCCVSAGRMPMPPWRAARSCAARPPRCWSRTTKPH